MAFHPRGGITAKGLTGQDWLQLYARVAKIRKEPLYNYKDLLREVRRVTAAGIPPTGNS